MRQTGIDVRAQRIFESCLYATDLTAAAAFYERVFGLELIRRFGDRGLALRCGRGVLLVFDPARAMIDHGQAPAHGATGPGHVAFLAMADELPRWRQHLARCEVTIDREVVWPEGGVSVYVRDPAGNSVELAPPELWNGLGFSEPADLTPRSG